MKSITNILLAIVMIIYIFFPLLETSVWGAKTGFAFTEETINNSSSIFDFVYALIPFVACFGAILMNCQKNQLWKIGSCILIGIGIYFYYDICTLSCTANNVKITTLGIGYNISVMLLWSALAINLLSFIPFRAIYNKIKKA